MGLRRVRDFNEAMLMKQAWRVLTNPESLSARLLKSRYFPYIHLWDATLDRNPSYMWRSIHSTVHKLREGCRWRVGDGNLISICKDSWLQDQQDPKIQSPVREGLYDEKVRSLLDCNSRGWDVDVIKDLFNSRDQNLIFSIPISCNQQEDK
ncbi:hypothetical protein Sjap_019042 [Stephania japonica]|uniref:Uncharacterized protein n=1 Tax=Stephania japonica TaxID=461633 RepID=A0AAP0HUC8_9MAGN